MPSILHRPRRFRSRQPGGRPANELLEQQSRKAWLTATEQERLITAFVALAILARLVRFLLRFPLWEDECFLVSNFMDRGFSDLLEPLNYHQVAPLGFLGVELAAVRLLGFNEWSLRLVPFICGIASVLLFRHLAGRLVQGPARLIAVATFCASYSGIRYAAEAKPYGVDLFVSLVMLTLAVEWWTSRKAEWLIALVAVAPLAIMLSYPAVFVGGGLSVFVALVLLREGRRGWLSWTALNATLLGSFLLMLRFAARGQAAAELDWMQNYWKEQLPSLFAPGQLLIWLLTTHTGDLLAIPLGGERGASTLSFLLVVAGLVALWRTRQFGLRQPAENLRASVVFRSAKERPFAERKATMDSSLTPAGYLIALCLAPAALNLAAAFMGRFPYGGHVKFSQYLAPAICLLMGVGAAALLGMGRGDAAGRRLKLGLALAALAFIPLGTMARDFVNPYKSATDARYRDFARWFWPNLEFAGEVACLQSDLGLEFAPGTFHHLGWSAMYLCNQRIYSPRHHHRQPVDWDRIGPNWPLHCVEYRAQVYRYDELACQRWLAEMGKRYKLVSRDTFPSPVFDQRGQNLLCADSLVLYRFVPR